MQKAKLGQDAEASNSGVVLAVLDPPYASIHPVAPKRPLLIIAVFVLGVAAAGALAYVLSKMNPVFNHVRELEEITARTVLGVVSLTNAEDVRTDERMGYRRYAAAVAGLVLAFVLVLLVSRDLPSLLA
jgi:hypothetical protein